MTSLIDHRGRAGALGDLGAPDPTLGIRARLPAMPPGFAGTGRPRGAAGTVRRPASW